MGVWVLGRGQGRGEASSHLYVGRFKRSDNGRTRCNEIRERDEGGYHKGDCCEEAESVLQPYHRRMHSGRSSGMLTGLVVMVELSRAGRGAGEGREVRGNGRNQPGRYQW
jgi:hypothetical protein